MAATHVQNHTALFSRLSSFYLIDLYLLPLPNASLCLYEQDFLSTVVDDGRNIITHTDASSPDTNVSHSIEVPTSECTRRYAILSKNSLTVEQPLPDECVDILSRAILSMVSNRCNFASQRHQLSRQDVEELFRIVIRLQMMDPAFFSRSNHCFDCPCNREECRVDDVLNALGCRLDCIEYNRMYNDALLHSGVNSSKERRRQLRVRLAVDTDSLPTTNQQDPDQITLATLQCISHQTNESISILPRSIQPLISIILSPIMEGLDSSMNVTSNPLLRSCVKRLLVGRKLLHSNIMESVSRQKSLRSILSVDVPSQYDSNEKKMLSYRVIDIQPKSSSSIPWTSQYVILPSTRIIFQLPVKKSDATQQQDSDDDHHLKTHNLPTILSQPKQSPANPKVIAPNQHLLEALRTILMTHPSNNNSPSPPPILRSFIFSGPPGVGKTFAVKQVLSIANSWFGGESVRLVSIRGSELLASVEGGQYASAARELEKEFRSAASFCGRVGMVEHLTGANKAVIIFLDECDALVSSSIVVAAMLAMLLDHMESTENQSTGWSKLLVVAATNRVDAIPSFLRRPGRLEKEVVVSPPDSDGRFVLLKNMLMQKDDDNDSGLRADVNDGDLRNLADACVGYVAADLAALVRRSAILAIERFFHNVDDQSSNDDRTSTISIQDLVNATNDIGASCLRDASLSAPPKTTWDDIAGDAGGAKQALRQAIEWPRTWKEAFKALGLSPPRGVLLHGPPGCAKTTLAKAAAGSAGVAFLSLSPADVYSSSYVGEAESVVRRAFDLARSAAPCVLFFDELDSIIGGEDEGSGHGMGRGSSAEARVLSTFLNEMDGVDGSVEDGVLVLGATNRPGTLDAALLRPGRFDRVIYVPPPDECGRKDILRMECSKWYESVVNAKEEDSQKVDDSTIDDYFNLSLLATNDITGWMTGAELVGACRETAVSVMRNTLMSQSHTVIKDIPQNISNELLLSLKTELEYTLRKTQPLLSNASVLEEYTRFEEEHK